jgi:NADH-quinone oxidoreductase subunit C
MDITEIFSFVKSVFEEEAIELKTDIPVETYLILTPKKVNAISLFLRDEENLQFDFLSSLSGVDYDEDNLAVVYNLYSFVHKHKMMIKIVIPKSEPNVNTVSDVWATANWHEREAYDLFGINFEGHPDLRRILLPDDWEGYPLRKDYKVQELYNDMKVPY